MLLRNKYSLLAISLILASSPATAQQSARDARCLLVSGIFSTSATDQNARQLANTTRSFFLGRLDGRFNASQLAAAVAAERRNVAQATMAATMNACAQYMNRQAQAVQNALRGTTGKSR